MNSEIIGEFIRRKRKEKNLTQKDLANKLGITDRAISKWERGLCCPDISLLKDLANLLEISVNELLSGKEITEYNIEASDKILVDSTLEYTRVEKKKTKKLFIFTIFILIFYSFLIVVMYFNYNQNTLNGKINFEIIETKKMSNKLFNYLENYDYNGLRKLIRNQLPTKGNPFVEDENNCIYYIENKKFYDDFDFLCKLKDFEKNNIKFIDHKYINSIYGGDGNFFVEYDVTVKYKEETLTFGVSLSTHNKVFNEISPFYYSNRGYISDNNIRNKIFYFFDNSVNYIETLNNN